MKFLYSLLIYIFIASTVGASELCFEVGHVCKVVSRLTREYRGTSQLESSRLLAEAGARRACVKTLKVALPNHPENYCDGDVDIEIQCEEVSSDRCHAVSFICKSIHWNSGEQLGVGKIKTSLFLAEGSAIQDCRKNHKKDLGYPTDYCESHTEFKCEEIQN